MERKQWFRFNVTLTWSKIMALVVLVVATVLDIHLKLNGDMFRYCLPFVFALITGKQGLDAIRAVRGTASDEPK